MRRLPDWRSRLHAALAAAQRQPFAWGTFDCCIFAARCIEAMTGEDLSGPYVGKYSDVAGALKTLKGAGFDDLTAMAAHFFAEVSPSMARVGDIAAMKAPATGWGLGIVIGPRIAVLSPAGYATIPLTKAERAFKVA